MPQTLMRVPRSPAPTLVLVICCTFSVNAAGEKYAARNADVVEVISLVLASEVRANNWAKDDLICLLINDRDPDRKLLDALRQSSLNVRTLSEWRKNFRCGYHVYLRFVEFDQSQAARLRADVADVREINSGDAHVAVRLRNGVYAVRKSEGKWSIGDYVPSK